MHSRPPGRTPAPNRTRILAALVGAGVLIGVAAALDPTTLRPGPWTTAYVTVLAVAGAVAVALSTVGRRWGDAALGAVTSLLMVLVVVSVLANQDRTGGILNVVLFLPGSVYAAVHLSRRVCRVLMLVLTACTAATMSVVAGDLLRWATLTALPLLAFLGTTEVVLRLRTELGNTLETVRRQASTDPLTGLANRRALQERLDAPADACSGFRTVLALDVDHFKRINDTLGHDVGDEVLRRFGTGLARETRRDDVVVRTGGEEFLVLSTASPERAGDVAESLRTRAAQWLAEWSVTVSVGVVSADRRDGDTFRAGELEDAVRAADACLYAAKDAGRDRVVTSTWR